MKPQLCFFFSSKVNKYRDGEILSYDNPVSLVKVIRVKVDIAVTVCQITTKVYEFQCFSTGLSVWIYKNGVRRKIANLVVSCVNLNTVLI